MICLFSGSLALILLLLCSDKRLVIFYSYTISLLVIYFDYQMSYKTDIQNSSSIDTYILQFLLSSIYIQMLNMRPRVTAYKAQTRLCHLAPFVLIVTRYLVSTNYSTSILKLYYMIWMLVHLSELFIFHQKSIVDVMQNRFIRDLYHLYDNFGLQTLLNYLQTRIDVATLLKIFWLTKIIVLPLGIRTIYTSPYISNTTLNINMMNDSDDTTTEAKDITYNQTLVKTIYFTSLFYGTETIFT